MKKYVIAYTLYDNDTDHKLFFFSTSNLPKYLKSLLGMPLYPWIDFDNLLKDDTDNPIPNEVIEFLKKVGLPELNQSQITLCEVPTRSSYKVI